MLHALFAPTSRKLTTDDQGKRNLIKYSIKDSQDPFIVLGESVDVMQQHLKQLRSRGDPIQPFIIIVGTKFSTCLIWNTHVSHLLYGYSYKNTFLI